MFPMKPEDAAMLVHRQHDELHEQVARERLARAAQVKPAEGGWSMAQHVGVAHRFWVGARHVLHPHLPTHGAAHGT